MNPHDPAKRPGAHLVAKEFGVEDPWALSDAHPLRDPLDLVGRLVAEAARDVDNLHGQLASAAKATIKVLEPIGRGDHASMRAWDGVLRDRGPQIELLAARRGEAYEHLTRAVDAYRRLLPDSGLTQPSKELGQELDLGTAAESARDDDWTIAGGRQLGALRAVEAGGLRFHQSSVYGYIYLSDGQGQRPNPQVWPETVQRLVADGLLERDTSEGLYRPGQLLSLTPNGEAALRTARATEPRVSAALRRSNPAAAVAGTTPDVAATPAGPAATPTRSR
ncbi:hypothetical protein [Streptomyces acidiscabies]|uniref:hypothetical protein n=1 Tax=Streptomyces acidiscabies TaxID=42234 RepID=UPI00067AF0E1|nr:hypothetical protein [Streptomyces acidiscabies]